MIEQLETLIRENAQELVVNNAEVPNEQNENVIQAASGSVVEVLKQQIGSGGIGGLLQSFTQGDSANVNSLIENVQGNFSQRLGALGLNSNTISSLSSSLIPLIMSKFFNQTGQGGALDLQAILNKFGGADGKFDLNDVMGMFGDKKGDDQSGDGLLGKLKGLF